MRALSGLLDVIEQPTAYRFEVETQLVYDMRAPNPDPEKSAQALQTLERMLPGAGTLASRVAAFRARFVIPPERRRAVFERALRECRARTISKWPLPAHEQLRVEWTTGVDAAWHRYEGKARSTLKINPDAVAYLSSAIDVACHEGYPGHHAQFVLMEPHANVEDTVVLLRSPVSMLREGAANYGIQLAFPPAERVAFERDVLFPLADLDSSQARKYAEVTRLTDQLSANVAPIVRDYRDRRIPAERARRELESAALIASPAPLLGFVDRYGPYVLGYTVARDKVAHYVETQRRATNEDPWIILRDVLEYSKVASLR